MKKIISLLLCDIILVNAFGVCSFAANETDSTLIPTPYFNNTSSIEVTFLINSSGLGTVATSYVGTSGITTHADISIKLEKKFLFFWTDVDIGYPDDTYSTTINGFCGMHEKDFQLSSTGTYRAVVTVTVYGSNGAPDVIESKPEAKY
jgi:hypothetical protein